MIRVGNRSVVTAEAATRAAADAAEAVTRAAADALKAPTFVFQPGGTAGGGVFTTWATLVAAVAAVSGYRRVLVDLTLVAYAADIPAGTWNFNPTGISGDVELAGKMADGAAGSPALTLTGACTIQGLTRLTNIQLVNKSTVTTGCLLFPAGQGALILEDTAQILQSLATAGGPMVKISSGLFSLFLKTNSLIDGIFSDAGTNGIQVAGGFVFIRLFAQSTFAANQLNKTGGTVIVSQSPDCTWASQASATAVVPSGGRQKGVTTLSSGVSPAITACIASGSRIVFGLKTPANDALTVKYAALGTDRSNGAQGSFKISALTAAGSAALNTADTSILDWEVLN